MDIKNYTPSRAQVSRSAIQRLQTSMRHLFMRGGYKPLGVSGETMKSSMLALAPEIYGSIANILIPTSYGKLCMLCVWY